ncbi:MAG: hypothetical protein QOG53_257 [Frankiales bacterium]|jgi:uncharacterized protein YndB with AHSA1/START domain|nr:hypothetical protein [Frankiales bacterium]
MPRFVDTVERVIAAPPEQIFALVADPRRHKDIDGSGTVRDARDLPEVSLPETIGLGSKFGMHMEFGGEYDMVNTVIEFEPNRRIAWQARPGSGRKWRGMFFGGRIWRYELEPAESGTRVRESWDITQEKNKRLVWGYRSKTHKNMERTLERIEQIVTSG